MSRESESRPERAAAGPRRPARPNAELVGVVATTPGVVTAPTTTTAPTTITERGSPAARRRADPADRADRGNPAVRPVVAPPATLGDAGPATAADTVADTAGTPHTGTRVAGTPHTGTGRPTVRADLSATPKSTVEQVLLAIFIVVPLAAVVAAVPVAWGWGLGWHDIVITAVMYLVTGFGITVGYHRHFTHGAFKAARPLKIALAIAGGLAIEMSVIDWVAAHRRHHKYSDQVADPHSPWRFGTDARGLAKGFLHAHVGWLFTRHRTAPERFCPDLQADPDIAAISARFHWLVAASVLIPPVVGGLWGLSWTAALTALFWGSLVRIALLHHVTFSINSVCHLIGERPFETRDRSRNVWWLAIASLGESWHNLHHADPTSARHGVLPHQVDLSAGLIRLFERLGWARDVRWPTAERIAARQRP